MIVGPDRTNCRFLCIYSAVKITTVLCDYALNIQPGPNPKKNINSFNHMSQKYRRKRNEHKVKRWRRKEPFSQENSQRECGQFPERGTFENLTGWKKKGRGRSCKSKNSAFISITNGCFILQQENKAPTVTPVSFSFSPAPIRFHAAFPLLEAEVCTNGVGQCTCRMRNYRVRRRCSQCMHDMR